MNRPRLRRGSASQLVDLGIAAPQVVAHRLARMAAAGTTPSARDRREFTGMVLEKQTAEQALARPALFRRVPNLFEIVPMEFWKRNYGFRLPGE